VGWAAAADVVYVSSFDNDAVVRFNADTGAPLGVFVPSGSGGLNGPTGLTFGPDGNLYVSSFALNQSVLRYHGKTGQFLGVFVTQQSGGLLGPMDLAFGPDGYLYVVRATKVECFATTAPPARSSTNLRRRRAGPKRFAGGMARSTSPAIWTTMCFGSKREAALPSARS